MRSRALLSTCAIALVAASCSQPEPYVLSEPPRSTSSADLTSTTAAEDQDSRPGRFIARCETEADGGTPGMTVFTDGSSAVTDHCLSRFYIGVQPAPGALYVPDQDAGTYAPTRGADDSATSGWTPAQPRTDTGLRDAEETGQPTPDGADGPDRDPDDPGSIPSAPVTSPDGTTPTVTPPSSPEETAPTSPGETPGEPPTTEGTLDPSTGEPTDPTPGTTVPTVTETAGPTPSASETSVTSTAPSDPLQSVASVASDAGATS